MPEEKVSSVQIPKNAGELANNWDKHEKVSDPQRGQWVQRCVTWSFPHQCCIQPLPPAADAGPRQPDAEYDDPRSMGNCMKHGDYDGRNISCPKCAVPQEAAPRLTSGLSKGAGYKTLGAFPVPCATNSSEEATAPDSAMRVAREITTRWQKWQVAYAGNFAGCDTHGGPVPPTEREVAALIREAGSEREREPHSSQVHTDLTVRCSKCKGTLIWRYFEEKDEIEVFHNCNDSNQELRAALLTAKELVEPLIETDSDLAPEWDAEAKAFLAEASRLLGGESK